MLRALPLLGAAPFIAVSADIVGDFDYATLPEEPAGLAHLVMVPNPDFLPRGDFWLDGAWLNEDGVGERLTFGNIGVYRPELVAAETAARFKLLVTLVRDPAATIGDIHLPVPANGHALQLPPSLITEGGEPFDFGSI